MHSIREWKSDVSEALGTDLEKHSKDGPKE